MTTAVDDDLWSAIGDPTRRRMLDLLLNEGGGTATTLSDQLPVTRQAVAKHLGVLDRVGLVHGSLAGRERRYEVDEAQLARAAAQLTSVGRRLGRPPEPHQADRRGDPAQPGRLTLTPHATPSRRVAAPMKRAHTRATHTGKRTDMVDILHRIGATASQEDVYAALTTIDGLAGWWTEDTTGDDAVGGVIRFRFAGAPEPGGFDMKVLDATPADHVLLGGRRGTRGVGRHRRSASSCPRRTATPS